MPSDRQGILLAIAWTAAEVNEITPTVPFVDGAGGPRNCSKEPA
jgi:hypothetical protein